MNAKWRVLAAMAIFLAGIVVGYFLEHLTRNAPQRDQSVQQSQQSKLLGKWEAKFKPPATVRLPDQNPVVKFEFGATQRMVWDSLTVTITNETDSPYCLSYVVYGYDSKGRRVSEDTSGLQIAGHESVVRQITLETSGGLPRPAAYFIVAARADL